MQIRAKNILRVGDTLCDQWKCVTHENFVLELDAIGYNYEKTFISFHFCFSPEFAQEHYFLHFLTKMKQNNKT